MILTILVAVAALVWVVALYVESSRQAKDLRKKAEECNLLRAANKWLEREIDEARNDSVSSCQALNEKLRLLAIDRLNRDKRIAHLEADIEVVREKLAEEQLATGVEKDRADYYKNVRDGIADDFVKTANDLAAAENKIATLEDMRVQDLSEYVKFIDSLTEECVKLEKELKYARDGFMNLADSVKDVCLSRIDDINNAVGDLCKTQ